MGYYYSDDYLEHHGILGQKWGVRRFQRKDGTRTAAGKARQAENAKKSGLTDEQKKYIKIGLAVAGTALAAYGGYKLATNPKVQAKVNDLLNSSKGKRIADLDEVDFGSFDPSQDSIKTLFADSPKADIIKSEIDDFFDSNPGNNLSTDNAGLKNNCIACALQNVLSKSGIHGYHARSSTQVDSKSGMVLKQGFSLEDVKDAFKGTNIEPIKGREWGSIRSEINSLGEGAKGIIGNTRIIDGKPTKHAISFEVKNGKTVFADNQSANKMVDMLIQNKGLSREEARSRVYSVFSDMSDDLLNSTSIFDGKDNPSFIRIDTATGVDYDKLDKLLT